MSKPQPNSLTDIPQHILADILDAHNFSAAEFYGAYSGAPLTMTSERTKKRHRAKARADALQEHLEGANYKLADNATSAEQKFAELKTYIAQKKHICEKQRINYDGQALLAAFIKSKHWENYVDNKGARPRAFRKDTSKGWISDNIIIASNSTRDLHNVRQQQFNSRRATRARLVKGITIARLKRAYARLDALSSLATAPQKRVTPSDTQNSSKTE